MNSILIFLFVLSGVFIVLIVLGILWSIRSGQFDDMQGPAARILMDDDDPRLPGKHSARQEAGPDSSTSEETLANQARNQD